MLIHPDSWNHQFFEDIDTQGTTIPVWDGSAYLAYKNLNWVYDKIRLMKSQNIPAFPHGINPTSFPVFSKPITNLWGMSMGAKQLNDWNDKYYQPGHFWMSYLEGTHWSIDAIMVDGKIQQTFATEGIKDKNNSFLQWNTCVECPDNIIGIVENWAHDYLFPFTGVVNFEMIGNVIIECHLRMSCQFIDLYGEDWMNKVVKLYKCGLWKYQETQPGFSCVIRTTEPGIYSVSSDYKDKVKHLVSSVQITIPESGDVTEEANDEYTYALAYANGFNLGNCKQAMKIINVSLMLTSD